MISSCSGAKKTDLRRGRIPIKSVSPAMETTSAEQALLLSEAEPRREYSDTDDHHSQKVSREAVER